MKGDKKIQFTIANPYILDEQYSGAVCSSNICGLRIGSVKIRAISVIRVPVSTPLIRKQRSIDRIYRMNRIDFA